MNEVTKVYKFQKISNFREFGGYTTNNGEVIQFGKLFRSGHLANASSRDLDKLSKLGIRTIIDLRTQFESNYHPDRLPVDDGIQSFHIPINDSNIAKLFRENLPELQKLAENSTAHDIMIQIYQNFITKFTNEFREFIHTVLEYGDDPILWHCTGGKDRTGFASALILKILDVPDEKIYDDFLLSRIHMERLKWELLILGLKCGMKTKKFVKGLIGINRNWLETSFKVIDQQWGSFDNYIHDGLNLTEENINTLKTKLLS